MPAKQIIDKPELFFCIVAPIGTDVEQVTYELSLQLKLYGYDTETIQITSIFSEIDNLYDNNTSSLFDNYQKKIDKSNELRERFNDDSLMAKLAFFMIQNARKIREDDPTKKGRPVAYVIRQFKRSEEITLFRDVYGKQVFQISAYADPDLRRTRLATKMRDADPSRTRSAEFESLALKLIDRDEHEFSVDHGQRLRDVFPLADLFIDATTNGKIKSTLERFIKIVFGYNFHSPTREEYGMYIAKSASLRSLDLSRQVGAAVFSKAGEIKTIGCNEVPSPNGGTYWEGDAGDAREFHGRVDTNEDFKHRLLSDTLRNLAEASIVDKKYASMNPREFLKTIQKTTKTRLDKKMMMMDIIEYGRIIHAEMNAITDAARKGIALQDTTLFCTTFPCHLCAKHIISSGINRVVYIEPYPKSYASELYREDIILKRDENPINGKVYFEPFIGIAPFRYRDFFEKSKRKDAHGKASDWMAGKAQPMLTITGTEYIEKETAYQRVLIDKFAKLRLMLSNTSTLGDEPSTPDTNEEENTTPRPSTE